MMEAVVILVALAFAVNIGASGTAAAMGEAYGTGAAKRWVALGLVAVFAPLGAFLAGQQVVKTVGGDLLSGHAVSQGVSLVIMASAILPLFLANVRGIPLSTSEVTVGAVVGVGLALGWVNGRELIVVVATWAILPFLAFGIGALAHRRAGIKFENTLADTTNHRRLRRVLSLLLIAGGAYTAFAAGSNNAANAAGPLVSAGVLSVATATILAGLFMGVGALALGRGVLETNGKRLTHLTLPAGIIVQATTGSLVLFMSVLGIPVPLTQTTTGAIIGVGFARRGRQVFQKAVVRNILSVWLISPAVAMTLSYFLTVFIRGLQGQITPLIIVLSLASAIALLSLAVRSGWSAVYRLHLAVMAVAGLGAANGKAAEAEQESKAPPVVHLERELVAQGSHQGGRFSLGGEGVVLKEGS